MQPDFKSLRTHFLAALAEDIGRGDITSEAVLPRDREVTLEMVARQELVVCGVPAMRALAELVSRKIALVPISEEGQKIKKNKAILQLKGPAKAILKLERTALNYMSHLSAIATYTAQFVTRVEGTHAKILDTRKTLPGMRTLEKYAVRVGGGHNHRMRLDDVVLIKDNHIAIAGGVGTCVRRARNSYGNKFSIVVECDSKAQATEALAAGVDRILLDNMSVEKIKSMVKYIGNQAEIEASGGINLENVKAIAKTGVDYISVGALTHSAPHVDIGLDWNLHPGE